MRIIPLTILFSFLLTSIFGQTCVHNDLSRTLRVITRVQRKSGDSVPIPKCPIEVTIIDKVNKKTIQVISFLATLYPGSFTKCSWVRSHSTGKNRNTDVKDTDFGDI